MAAEWPIPLEGTAHGLTVLECSRAQTGFWNLLPFDERDRLGREGIVALPVVIGNGRGQHEIVCRQTVDEYEASLGRRRRSSETDGMHRTEFRPRHASGSDSEGASDATGPHSDDGSDSVCGRTEPWDVQLERLAAAFELTVAEVRQDWSRVQERAADTNDDVVEHLRVRHGWDASIAPYYVKWLRRACTAN